MAQLVGSLLFGADNEVAAWVASRLRQSDPFERSTALGIVRHGRLVAGIVFHRFNGFDLELTVAAEPALWLWPRVARTVARYVFADLGARRITLRIAARNRASRRLAAGLGFTLEGTSPYAYDGDDALCTYGMAREACRFLKGRP